jgi:hypothetical protein
MSYLVKNYNKILKKNINLIYNKKEVNKHNY